MITIGCSPIKQTSSGYSIKGESKVISRLINNELEDTATIEGYIYSRLDSTFLKGANILVDERNKIGTTSDESGHFSIKIKPGVYDLKVDYIGHQGEKLERINIKDQDHILVLFELGTSVIY
ncbi:carboxypeptidase-like regulatory domain-containing protein [Catalinimonas locisalis]|uniref:carboxypeptidase-like regulatory domain-containing protein n=1 Tax=Catalinimonas locisalis TaxID=3133978 RepID=UPI0031014608